MTNIKYRQQKLNFYINYFLTEYQNLRGRARGKQRNTFYNFMRTFYRNDLSNKTNDKSLLLDADIENKIYLYFPYDFRTKNIRLDLNEIGFNSNFLSERELLLITEK